MNDIQEIKDRVGQDAKDIIINQLHLERVGTKYRCPNRIAHRHGDRNPSMAWDDNLMQFKCFGCGKLIDIYSLFREYLNFTHQEVVREILGKENIKDTSMAQNRLKFEDKAKELTELTAEQIEYLKKRQLTEETIHNFKLQNYQGSIAIPYYQNGVLIGCKTRKPQKHIEGSKYLSLTGSKPGFFNYDGAEPDKPLIISEGEFDCSIIHQAGFHNVVSVGAGANSLTDLIEQYKSFLDSFDSLIIFSDNDEAGGNMDRDFLKAFPDKVLLIDKAIMKGKDANEEYLKGGAEAIKKLVESAQEKIEGWYNPDTDDTSLEEVFARGKFIPTGLPSIDKCTNDLMPGAVTLVAGRSNSGKSTLINQIIANAIETENKTLLISGESDKRILINQIYKAIIGRDSQLYDFVTINKRQFKTPKKSVLEDLKEWHRDRLRLFMKGEASLKTTDQLFDLVSRKIKAEKYNLVILDNLMSLVISSTANEKYEKQGEFVQRCTDLAKLYHMHIIIVLHPSKQYRKGENLDFEQISGTSDMANRADTIISVIREYDAEKLNLGIDGYCEVIKNRFFSDLVKIPLHYDTETGCLCELNEATGKCSRYTFNIKRTKQRANRAPEGFQEIMPWEE